MNKTLKIYLVALVLVIGLLTVLNFNKQPLIDWRKSYDVKEKSPFGLYIFDQEADELFNQKLQRVQKSPYNFYSEDSLLPAHHILVIERGFDPESWKKIFKEIEKGGELMYIGSWIPQNLLDSFDLALNYPYFSSDVELSFFDGNRKAKITVDKLPNRYVFKNMKDEKQILGQLKREDDDILHVNFLKLEWGKGHVYLHTDPYFLTNYCLLREQDAQYAEQVFSYWEKDKETIWFRNVKQNVNTSIVRFILENKPLRYAWYLLLLSFLTFLIFKAKRKQRIIPVIEPLENKSVEFVRNIGNLYLNEGNSKDMMRKKVNYFLNRIRTELLIDTSKLDDTFIKTLQSKTNAEMEMVEKAVDMINIAMDHATNVSAVDLIELNKILDGLYK